MKARLKYNTTRRAVLIGAAVAIPATALTVAAVAAVADPIFPLIQAHRLAYSEMKRIDALWEQDLVDNEAVEATKETLNDACAALIAGTPTTLAGMAAYTQYVLTYDRETRESGSSFKMLVSAPISR